MSLASRHRISRTLVLAVVGVLLLAGCASVADRPVAAPTVASTQSVAVPTSVPSVTSPPGTPLADGFVVAEGSVLIGEAYPHLRPARSAPSMPELRSNPVSGWTAQILVIGEPLAVFNDYVSQASKLGYPMDGGCSIDDAQGMSTPLADYGGGEARLLRCEGEYYRATDVDPPEPVDALRVAVELVVGDLSGLPARTVNVSLLQVGDGSGDPEPFQSGPPLGPIGDPVPALPVLDPPLMPRVGEVIAPEFGSRVEIRVPVGSALAAVPSDAASCSPGYDAVLTTVDVDAALADLERQLGDLDNYPTEYLEERRNEVTFRTFSVVPVGGSAGVTGAEGAPTATILVSSC